MPARAESALSRAAACARNDDFIRFQRRTGWHPSTIIGNLGKDPETRYAPSGDAICNLTLATTETWKDKTSGERREATEWHRVVFFGACCRKWLHSIRARVARSMSKAGLQTRKWQDKEGQDRYTTEIRGDEMKMLGRREGGGDALDACRR